MATFRGLTEMQQNALISILGLQAKQRLNQGKSHYSIMRRLSVLVINSSDDAQSERTSTTAHKGGRTVRNSEERVKKEEGQ